MRNLKILCIVFFTALLGGCEKFLDEKTDKKLVVPNTLRDLQSLMDNFSNINGVSPAEGDLASDDYYVLDDVWASFFEEDQRGYIWKSDYSTRESNWFSSYRIVYYANIVLKEIANIDRNPSNQQNWDNVKGQAMFIRAKSFLDIVSIWSLAFDESTASTDLGIPLRLSDDYNIPSVRASVAETYEQIIADLKSAGELLPIISDHVTRPSKVAAFGLLARTYLFMRDYDNSLLYANECLEIKSELMDYNDLDPSPAYPIPMFNKEILYHCVVRNALNITTNVNNALVDTTLYDSYHSNDLRKMLFFRANSDGTHSVRGNYSGGSSRFRGVAIDEIYLIRAECEARRGNVSGAMDDLNKLLSRRYLRDSFTPFFANSSDEALQYVLEERRKELLFRGLRFPDVKRLNMEGARIGFRRILNGMEYTLPPNDLRFALSIPESVLELALGIQQNPR